VRYLPDTPEIGDLVAHGDELWTVTWVTFEAREATVVCEFETGDSRLLREID
jgi:hypothetical protein